MKLDSISIQNLRSLIKPQSFSLPPLTLVVGANSSGKSTFLRTFPLLRQSVETVTRGPILWFGPFVDFGEFKDAASRNSQTPEIEFGFTIKLSRSLDNREVYGFRFGFPMAQILDDTEAIVKLVISEDVKTSITYSKQVKFIIGNHTIQIDALPDGSVRNYLLNGASVRSPSIDFTLRSSASLFSMSMVRKEKLPEELQEKTFGFRYGGACPERIFEHVAPLFHGNVNVGRKATFIASLGIGSTASLGEQIKQLAGPMKIALARVRGLASNKEWLEELQGLLLADRIPILLNEIDDFLATTFRNVSYIGPLRATAERFYRQQDLAVDEVDPQGANLAMFLMGLNKTEQNKFSQWCEDNIGFTVQAEPIGAHVSIRLRDSKDGEVFNIADMGFGYSQLLPVLATMWRALSATPVTTNIQQRNRRVHIGVPGRNAGVKIIAVEQPELHLHPRFQGRLADLLCSIALGGIDSKSEVCLICETHSETIVNEIGKLISENVIKPEHVQVLLFEKNDGQGGTTVCKSEYDEEGILTNWPFGFFLPA